MTHPYTILRTLFTSETASKSCRVETTQSLGSSQTALVKNVVANKSSFLAYHGATPLRHRGRAGRQTLIFMNSQLG